MSPFVQGKFISFPDVDRKKFSLLFLDQPATCISEPEDISIDVTILDIIDSKIAACIETHERYRLFRFLWILNSLDHLEEEVAPCIERNKPNIIKSNCLTYLYLLLALLIL